MQLLQSWQPKMSLDTSTCPLVGAEIAPGWEPKVRCGLGKKRKLENSFKGPEYPLSGTSSHICWISTAFQALFCVSGLQWWTKLLISWSLHSSGCVPHVPNKLELFALTQPNSKCFKTTEGQEKKNQVHIWRLFLSLWTSKTALI